MSPKTLLLILFELVLATPAAAATATEGGAGKATTSPAPEAPPPPLGVTENAGPPPASKADVDALKGQIDSLRTELGALHERENAQDKARAEAEEQEKKKEAERKALEPPEGRGILLGRHITLGGYLQGQYEMHQDSTDQLAQGGALLNQDKLSLRRARLKVAGYWEYASFLFEIGGSTSGGGYSTFIERGEAGLHYSPEADEPPVIELLMGVIYQPFGWELLESSRDIYFMERSLVTRALFAGPQDLGARLGGSWKQFHYSLALMNGEPFGEKGGFPGLDPSGNKDLMVRAGFTSKASGQLVIGGNVSAMAGRGFHPGTSATKPQISWRDDNEDGLIQLSELAPVAALAATPSKSFDRWATGIDVEADLKTSLGVTHGYAAVVLAQNLDRFQVPADPITSGRNIREFGWYVAAVQELGEHAYVGARYDSYDPDSNALDSRGGRVFQSPQTIWTLSPLVGVQIPRARLSFQYDFTHDHLARNGEGLPADLKNNAWTLRLQVQL